MKNINIHFETLHVLWITYHLHNLPHNRFNLSWWFVIQHLLYTSKRCNVPKILFTNKASLMSLYYPHNGYWFTEPPYPSNKGFWTCASLSFVKHNRTSSEYNLKYYDIQHIVEWQLALLLPVKRLRIFEGPYGGGFFNIYK